MLASACAFPTESPNWDMTWNLPVPDNNGMSIGVASFLPSGVSVINNASGAPTAFSVAVSSIPGISRSLGTQCPSCPSATAPKPAFTAPQATTTINLGTTALNSATLFTGSQIVITLTNGFGFDPINPPGGTPGTITLSVTNGSATLGTLTLQGPTQTIPSGQTRQFTIPLSGTINLSSPLSVSMTMDSPQGGTDGQYWVTMSPSQTFGATATATINISNANVSIAAQTLTPTATPIDLSEVDSSVVNRIVNDNQNRGTMFLTVTNPFTVGANATITFQSPATVPVSQRITPITKTISIAAAANGTTPNVQKLSIALTGQELRRMFGRDLEAVFGGTTQAGNIAVTPTLKIAVSSRIQVNFTVKEQETP
jgi:hypothetical protein